MLSVVADFGRYFVDCLMYLLYRTARTVLYATQMIPLVKKEIQTKYETSAEVKKIVWKRKFFSMDVTSSEDFMSLHEKHVHPNYVLKSNVSLYCVDLKEAIFVETDPGINVFRFETDPFQYTAQFRHASKVIRMPVDSLCSLAAELGDPRIQASYLANTGRCGSTLLTKLLEKAPRTMVHSEPDALTNLAFLKSSGKCSFAEYERILIATIRILCKPQPGVDRVCIKTRSCGSVHIDTISKHFPDIKLLYGYRNSLKTVKSFLGLMISESVQSVAKYFIDSDIFSFFFPFFRHRMYFYFCKALDKEPKLMRPQDMNTVEMFTYGFAKNIQTISNFKCGGGNVHTILYEDMVQNPQQVCLEVFRLLGIEEKYVSLAVGVFGEDSQKGTVLSQQSIANDRRRSITDEHRDRADKILKMHGFPSLGSPVVL